MNRAVARQVVHLCDGYTVQGNGNATIAVHPGQRQGKGCQPLDRLIAGETNFPLGHHPCAFAILLVELGLPLIFSAPDGRLGIVPVGALVAPAHHKIDIVRELFGIAEPEPPVAMVVAMPKFGSGAIGGSDAPEQFAMAARLPGQGPQLKLPRRVDRHVVPAKLAHHAIGDGIERIGSVANRWHLE